jgi:hypothetical protein
MIPSQCLGFFRDYYFAKETGDFDERKIPDVDQIDLAFASFDHIVPTASL